MEPMNLIMIALIGLLVIMMVRNGRKRREQAATMQQGLVPGAEVMLQTGIYGTLVRFDEEDENRAVLMSGDSTIVVHRNAIAQIVTPIEVEPEAAEEATLAPDDDPAFGESLNTTEDTETQLPEANETPNSDDK